MKTLPELLFKAISVVGFILVLTATAVSGTLAGAVVDNFYFNPLPGVEVSAYRSDSTLAGVDTTDVDGEYSLILDAGNYYATFIKQNYADTTIEDINITPDGTTVVDLTLRFVHNCDYIAGDVNGVTGFNGLDVTYGMSYFKRGTNPPFNCLCECTPGHIWYVCGDVNGSCSYNGLDITYAVTIYQGGPWVIPCPDCPPIIPIQEVGGQKR